MIYLDNAATSFIKPREVYKAVERSRRNCSSPSRGGYAQARNADAELYACRESAAELFGCDPINVAFTQNATHALNIAINTIVKPGMRVIVSGYEHNAVIRPLNAVEGVEIITAGVKSFNYIGVLNAFKRLIDADTGCVICTTVSNVFGYTMPVREIGELCRKYSVPFIIDASQGAGSMDISAESADFLAMPGHKGLFGLQGSGLLISRGTILPEPLIRGGTGSNSRSFSQPDFMPDMLESGTAAVPSIAGLGAGMRFVLREGAKALGEHAAALVDYAEERLKNERRITLFRKSVGRHLFSFAAEGIGSEEFAERLAARGVALRAGLHCAPCRPRERGDDRAWDGAGKPLDLYDQGPDETVCRHDCT